MKNEEKLIEGYLNKTLSTAEEKEFFDKLENDPAFANEANLYIDMEKIIEAKSKARLKEKIKRQLDEMEYEGQFVKTSKIPFYRRLNYMKIAAAAVLIIVSSTYWYAHSNYSNSALFADVYQSPKFSGIVQTLGEGSHENYFSDVKEAYGNKEYSKAIELLISIDNTSPLFIPAKYNLGNLYLITQQSSKAISAFESINRLGSIRYQEDVEWNLVLAYLQNKDLINTKIALKGILQDSNHSYFTKAQILNNKMDNPWRSILFID